MGETSVWVPEGTNQDREDFKYVGTWDHPGRQSWDMVSGAAKYPTDLWMDGNAQRRWRCAARTAMPRLKSLDISEAEKMEGVKLVLTYEDEELALHASPPPWRTTSWARARFWATRPSSRATRWAPWWWP